MNNETQTKKSKTTLIVSLLVIIIVAILTIVGIMAYLTDTESAVNTFTIGKVDIDLDEGGWNPTNAENITANEEIVKQPKVTNVGANEAYVYLKVKVPKVQLKESDTETSPLFTYTVNEGWSELEEKTVETDEYIERVYYYNEDDGKLAVNVVTPTLFDKVKVANITSETKYKTEDGMVKRLEEALEQNIEINAYAIQVDNLPEGKQTVQKAYDVILGNEDDDTTLIAKGIKVGDYVNYDASSGNGAGLSYTVDTTQSGSTEEAETFNSSDMTKWRVLSIKNGQIKLIAEEPTNQILRLQGKDGYKNAEKILNDIGAIYGKGNGAESGRSITVEDLEEHTNFIKTDYTNPYGYKYNSTEKYSSGTFIMEDGTEKTASESNPVTMNQTYYDYSGSEYKKDEISFDLIYGNSRLKPFWLANQCVNMDSEFCYYGVRSVEYGYVDYGGFLFYSRGVIGNNSLYVVPVVTLQSGIRGEKGEDGVWNLNV